MSAFFCFTLPIGMGLYWIAGSVIRTVQQIFINKHIDKMDFDEIIKKNETPIATKVLAASVSYGTDAGEVKNWNINGQMLNIGVKKA